MVEASEQKSGWRSSHQHSTTFSVNGRVAHHARGRLPSRHRQYPPGMRVGLGAPRNPVAVQVLGGIGVVIGLVLTFLALAGVSVFHLFGH